MPKIKMLICFTSETILILTKLVSIISFSLSYILDKINLDILYYYNISIVLRLYNKDMKVHNKILKTF